MVNGIDYGYLWQNEKEYKRLTIDQLNNEACLNLAEAILCELREVYEKTAKGLFKTDDEKAISNANALLGLLRGDTVNGLTLGHGQEVVAEFLSMCPSHLLKINEKGLVHFECPRKDGEVAGEESRIPQTNLIGG